MFFFIFFNWPLYKDQLSSVEQFDIAINLASEQANNSKFIFVIDSIDQMDINSCSNISWLPKMMPQNTVLLLSTVSDENFEQLNSNIRRYYGDRITITDIQPLNDTELDEMTTSYLKRFNRTLQLELLRIITESLFPEVII